MGTCGTENSLQLHAYMYMYVHVARVPRVRSEVTARRLDVTFANLSGAFTEKSKQLRRFHVESESVITANGSSTKPAICHQAKTC